MASQTASRDARSPARDALRALMPDASEARVDAYALPVCAWVDAQVRGRADPARPLVLGVHGPQGGGKSTLCAQLVAALGALGHRAAALSVDDAYLTHAEQRALAERNPGNRYLEHRGYPGTHDVGLAARTLDALRAGSPVRVPAYDKSAHGGRGDRVPEARWAEARGPFDAVLFEGWMLGFVPVDPALVPDAHFAVCNEALRSYDAWNARLDALVHLDATEPTHVLTWRVDAERARRARGESALSDAQALEYVERFLPAYRVWEPGLRASPPLDGPVLHVPLGLDRLPAL